MNEQLIADIGATLERLSVGMADIREKLERSTDGGQNKLSLDARLPDMDVSPIEIFASFSELKGALGDIRISNGTFAPKALLTPLLTKLNELFDRVAAVSSVFANVEANGGIKSIDAGSFSIVANNDSAHHFAKPLRNLFTSLDEAFASWYHTRPIIKAPRLAEFGKLAIELERQRNAVHSIIEDANSTASEAKRHSERLTTLLGESIAAKDEIVRISQEGQTDRKTIAEYAAEATTKLADIRSTDEKSAEFDTAIDNYQTKFSEFEKSIEQRNQSISKETESLQGIHRDLESKKNELSRLLSEAEGLLKGATNVGLASSFSGRQAKIAKELVWARLSFYLSILFLIVLSIPIALYVFPGLQTAAAALGINLSIVLPRGSIGEHSAPDTLAQIAARALLLIPGIWLVRFTSARHERLFRLREHYAYKYSIASSVEGFKKQAPDLEQGIAAAAFHELTFNPATRMDANSVESRYPNPIMDWVLKKLAGQQGEKT
ncbi:MAG: hypothetical protein WBB98_17425 [Xanthobacteraceae bacterium]